MQFVQIDGEADGVADNAGELYPDPPEAPVAVAPVIAVPAEGMLDV
jgi:hypothetical protein